MDAPSAVLEDECEIDLLGLDRFVLFIILQTAIIVLKVVVLSRWFCRDLDANSTSYLVVQTPSDRNLLSQLNASMAIDTGSRLIGSFK